MDAEVNESGICHADTLWCGRDGRKPPVAAERAAPSTGQNPCFRNNAAQF
ncbi:hypothetical protein Ga0080574_TMP3238 [Salipiger abyssi]|uniref:Uncharacterized protein n=1 Tax=Salipiger abyssi TaxID=1250539 RepID=A0A1P8UW06_9RHOB|nr:hypothetical protein Ga0080574_TMP3238 [Salipiger abyssi]